MTKLSVNVNKIATLRNSRGGNNPNLFKVSNDIERFGAQGITVHPRPDERHIRYSDVYELKQIVNNEFNIEGYPSDDFCNIVCSVKPTQVTLVPDAPEQLTSNHGWDTRTNKSFLTEVTKRFKEAGIRVSIFIDADNDMAEYASIIGADRIEMYTEPYAARYNTDKEAAIAPFIETANFCKIIGLGINAGHDLSLENLHYFHQRIPFVDEVSIGHALICDALYLGLEQTVKNYLQCLK